MPWRRERRRYNTLDINMFAAAAIPIPYCLFPIAYSLLPCYQPNKSEFISIL